jgi:[ribulose-bisphosphate carboxylase]-lysine N-methyltransferase
MLKRALLLRTVSLLVNSIIASASIGRHCQQQGCFAFNNNRNAASQKLITKKTITTRPSFNLPTKSIIGFSTNTSTKLHQGTSSSTTDNNSGQKSLETLEQISNQFNQAVQNAQPEFIKTCKVKLSPIDSKQRLGLIATENIKKGDVALAVPYDDQIILSPDLALNTVYKGILPEEYDGWTGDNGLIALLLLNELAKTAAAADGGGIALPKRKPEAQSLIDAWISTLPSQSEMNHPLLWTEDEQEALQSSSTKKIYRLLDDIEDDVTWLEERIWKKDGDKDDERFPEKVMLNGEEYDCFNLEGYRWAIAITSSRSVFVDGSLRLIPFLDMANHEDFGVEEIQGGTMGRFGTTKGAELRTPNSRKYTKGEQVFCTYGPKSAAEYLLEHGFIPKALKSTTNTCVAELTFEIDSEDRFYDDKLDILEFDTYDSAPMEPSQSFDLVSGEIGRDGDPDPAMIQFLRLAKVGAMDAFLLESIFRSEVWGFMSLPVSEKNERAVMDTIGEACTKALEDMGLKADDDGEFKVDTESIDENDVSPTGLTAVVRGAEQKALSKTLEFVNREKEALDLKEYYQERRLKDLGLDSEWSPDDYSSFDPDEDMGFGQSRAPGSLDW